MVSVFLTGCSRTEEQPLQQVAAQDTAAVIYGPSLTELFYEAGIQYRIAAVDRFSVLPFGEEVPRAGDFLSPSLETITRLGATSIHVVGSNQSLTDLAGQMGIPCYTYNFDTMEDMAASCRRIQELYTDADLQPFVSSVDSAIDSLSALFSAVNHHVMIVIYMEADGAITLAGHGTFYADIIEGIGCTLSAPEAGSYPSVSVEGIMWLDPDRVIILAPEMESEQVLGVWEGNGLSPENVSVLTGDHVLIPGARLPLLIRELGNCLN